MKNKRFTLVYKNYGKLVMKIILDKSRDVYAAEEICQQTFEAYYRSMDHIQEDMIKPWLMFTARKLVIDYLRRKKKREKKFASLYLKKGSQVSCRTEEAGERISKPQPTDRILDELREENEDWFDVLEAVCILEMKPKELSRYLRLSPQVLRSKLFHAKKYIRENYGEKYKDQIRSGWDNQPEHEVS